ncbi:MAG TPA: PP0621 family protein [Pseudomonas sp.]|nr:PP0621 family protein [Pseudomonas sp.]
MGLFRLLFWLAVILAALWLWQRLRKPSRPKQDLITPMVRCSQCGVHVPQTRALTQDGRWYCSQAHLEQGPPSSER